jgi:hypothetical protein
MTYWKLEGCLGRCGGQQSGTEISRESLISINISDEEMIIYKEIEIYWRSKY